MTGISYNDTTPSVRYGYDDYGAWISMTDGEGAMSYTYNASRQLTSETRTFTGLSGNNYTFNYSYKLGGQLNQANYVAPNFNKNVNYAYNATGALNGIGTNLIGSAMDGKLIACNYLDEVSGRHKIAVIPFAGGPPVKIFDELGGFNRPLQWTPDGRAIAFIRTTNGVSNLWAQPLAGGEPKQLTEFKDQRIFNFVWSRDGKQLALSRGVVNSDVVRHERVLLRLRELLVCVVRRRTRNRSEKHYAAERRFVSFQRRAS